MRKTSKPNAAKSVNTSPANKKAKTSNKKPLATAKAAAFPITDVSTSADAIEKLFNAIATQSKPFNQHFTQKPPTGENANTNGVLSLKRGEPALAAIKAIHGKKSFYQNYRSSDGKPHSHDSGVLRLSVNAGKLTASDGDFSLDTVYSVAN